MNMYTDDALDKSQAMNKLLIELVKNQRATAKSTITAFIITVICYTALLIAMIGGFFWYEIRFEVTEQTVIETITQEVSDLESGINSVE